MTAARKVVPIRPDMLAKVMGEPAPGTPQPFNPHLRGFCVSYHVGRDVPHCPGCDRRHWHVGRVTAECAFCGTALPLGN